MSPVACTFCQDQGYVSLPGLAQKEREILADAPDNLLARIEAVGVATLYRCEFCNAADEVPA